MDIKSKILEEVKSELGSGYVQMMNDAFNKCQTLKNLVLIAEINDFIDLGKGWSREIFNAKPIENNRPKSIASISIIKGISQN